MLLLTAASPSPQLRACSLALHPGQLLDAPTACAATAQTLAVDFLVIAPTGATRPTRRATATQ